MEESPRRLSKPALAGARVAVCLSPRALLACLLSFSTFLSVGIDPPAATAAEKKPKPDTVLKGLPITALTADEAILHALNRLAYGPRPGDIERIKQTGLAKWIEQQLNPNSINDSSAEVRLEIYPTLRMHTPQLLAEYPNPKQAAKQELNAQNRNANLNQQPGAAAAEVIARDMQSKSAAQDPLQQPAQGAEAAITAMAQEMESTPAAGKASDSSGAAIPAPTTDAPSPMKLNTPTRGASQRDPLGMDPNAVPRAISDDSRMPMLA